MDTMMSDPSTQQLLLSRMPPHMRRPEVLRAMMANPEVRQRISALAQQTVSGGRRASAAQEQECGWRRARGPCGARNNLGHVPAAGRQEMRVAFAPAF
jgi:hypothetical protein